jgi:hypothetical protein
VKIRRARAHSTWQRLVRSLTPLERYACGNCGFRGWRIPSPAVASTAAADLGLAPRPREERDRRQGVKARRHLVRGVLVAVALGVVAALLFVLGE